MDEPVLNESGNLTKLYALLDQIIKSSEILDK
jgi:hypothetical protein